MIFYKLLCIPPNLEIFLTGVYTFWCLCSREILSVYHLLDKTNACWSTNGSGLEENSFVTYLKYSVVSLHIFQFILAYAMLAAGILTIYPILFNKSATLLNPIIITCTLRQLYSNSVAIILGACLCYCSGSNFQEFQCFFGRFLLNTIVSYYIICSYEDFQRYIRRKTLNVAIRDAQVIREHFSTRRPVINETRSENSFVTDWSRRSGNKFMNPLSSLERNKILPSDSSIPEDIDSLSSSIPTMGASKSTETFRINLINNKTKADLISFTITK